MSPEAGLLLVNEIMPIISATVPRVVRRVGSEDAGELVQDAMCSAAQMVEASEQAGKPLYPSGIAYYAIQRTKSGRRSMSAGRSDAMCPGVQLDRTVSMDSMDAAIEDDSTAEETVTLHDVLAAQTEDPSQMAARELDWSDLLQRLSDREIQLLTLTAEGGRLKKLARKFGVSEPRVCQLRRELGQRVQEMWGATALQDATSEPAWKERDIRTVRERTACRRERWLAAAR